MVFTSICWSFVRIELFSQNSQYQRGPANAPSIFDIEAGASNSAAISEVSFLLIRIDSS
jgi:hypothetical protein